MSTIILSISESDSQLISGIPEYIEFDTNVPATVFYTLDGEDPDTGSIIASGLIHLPTTSASVTVKAVAMAGGRSSAIFEEIYRTDVSGLNGPRHIGPEGITVIPYGSDIVDNMSYDLSGNAAQKTAIEFVDLDIKASMTDSKGVKSVGGGSVSFVKMAIDQGPIPIPYDKRSSTDDASFDPSAGVILIDGSTQEKLDEQVVRVVNRAYNSMDTVSDFYSDNWRQEEQVITGNLVRSIYNPNTGIMASYYWESKECRWLVSKQKIDPKRISLSPKPSGRGGSGKFVYRWIQDRAASRIF
jgi:hypothetical protein